jgi:hypothetical protein
VNIAVSSHTPPFCETSLVSTSGAADCGGRGAAISAKATLSSAAGGGAISPPATSPPPIKLDIASSEKPVSLKRQSALESTQYKRSRRAGKKSKIHRKGETPPDIICHIALSY